MDETTSVQENHLIQARGSLQQTLSWYSSFRRHWNYPPNIELQNAVRQDLQNLKTALEKLDRRAIRIAAFGLVSRGKSSVVNALLGEKMLPTGAIHGVTQWPKSVRWTSTGGKVEVELIDTPGLDEIEGETRAEMAREVAYQADLILFVVAGDITRTEYRALCELRKSQKPLLLVFNKIDLYPEVDRQEIYRQLQKLGTGNNDALDILSTDEIVMVAAEPQPIPVRLEYPDGTVKEEWESLPPQIEELKEKILTILNREGRSLLAINSLVQARDAERNIANKTVELRAKEADRLIWKYARSKALAVAINPIAVLDIAGGIIADLSLIRSLARLYGLPITSHEAGKLWRKIVASSGWLILGELASNFILGIGKTSAGFLSAIESPAAMTAYTATAATQAGVAGYGAYLVGKIAQEYLENGCTWSASGTSRVIEDIISQVDRGTLIYRLKREIGGSSQG
jgi:uncharacterized protein